MHFKNDIWTWQLWFTYVQQMNWVSKNENHIFKDCSFEATCWKHYWIMFKHFHLLNIRIRSVFALQGFGSGWANKWKSKEKQLHAINWWNQACNLHECVSDALDSWASYVPSGERQPKARVKGQLGEGKGDGAGPQGRLRLGWFSTSEGGALLSWHTHMQKVTFATVVRKGWGLYLVYRQLVGNKSWLAYYVYVRLPCNIFILGRGERKWNV